MRLSRTGNWLLEVEETESTQTLAAELLRAAGPVPSVVLAHQQTKGRGRFDRSWHSRRGESLTMSLILSEYADHPMPWLVGMAVACATAAALHCQIQWPNDLIHGGKKLGGILTDMVLDSERRRVPVVGVGINLNQTLFPDDIAPFATSLRLIHGTALFGRSSIGPRGDEGEWAQTGPGSFNPKDVAMRILDRVASMPEPESWDSISQVWCLFDASENKSFKLPDGRIGKAIRVGDRGELICSVDGEPVSVMAADAIYSVEPL